MLNVTTTVSYKIPSNDSCRLSNRNLCRFCTLSPTGGFQCVLHDEELDVKRGTVFKCTACLDCHNSTHTHTGDPVIDVEPMSIVKHAVNEFSRVYKALRRRNYSESIALSLAKEHVTEERNIL